MYYELPEELIELKSVVKEFVKNEVYPLVAGWDQENGHIPKELKRKFGELGLLGLTVPEEYGGSEMGFLALCVAIEEITRNSHAGVTGNIMTGPNCAFTAPFLHFGTEEQKRKYVPGTAAGILGGAVAITEPSGSSAMSSMSTTAVLKGSDYIVNGQKIFISHADSSDYIETLAMTDEGPTYFVVDTNAPGVTVGKSENKMGLRGTGLNPIYYDNVVIPKENMIGKPGQGLKVVSAHHNAVRTGVSAAAVGMAQGAIDLAVEYAKGRMLHGKALSSFQNTQFVLAECQTKVDAARLMVYQSAKALDEGKQEYYMASMAKYFASEVCGEVVDKCLQVFGGYGYCCDYDIERMYRDVRVYRILDGASEVHKRLISKYMGVR